ncbi:mitogen-activated protein kinase kinase kinase 20-like [Cornus florida]|uniref:mitogen-activated protein kinase kinase kinase 20-like n=1 Tax=Cornus florida TaxID=4283 RepID=UPI0028A20DA6|nr:mitogen-activated protein kinase kinase kinase 20-like [Cornus florida]
MDYSLIGDPRDWVKSDIFGTGRWGTVYLARNPKYPLNLIAIKTVSFSADYSPFSEREVLEALQPCPEIISCYGDDFVTEQDGQVVYHLLLEYAPGGTLHDLIKNSSSGGKLPEINVRGYTRMILKGVIRMHQKGYFHNDLKATNILVFLSEDGVIDDHVKIADFNLVKKVEFGLCMSCEKYHDVSSGDLFKCGCVTFEESIDILALGGLVMEMVTGEPAKWSIAWEGVTGKQNKWRSTFCPKKPEILEGMSDDGKDFLRRCLVEEPRERWKANMLLNHPFVAKDGS